MSEQKSEWKTGEVVKCNINGNTVYGKVFKGQMWQAGTGMVDGIGVYPFNWNEIPNELKAGAPGYLDITGWEQVPDSHYYVIRENILGIIENGAICDEECDNKGKEDCYVMAFSVDDRNNAFRSIYGSVVDHYKKYGDMRDDPVPPGRARTGELEG